MNKQRKDVLNILYRHSVTNQREISELSGHSLGVVNKSIKELMNQGYINEKCSVTTKALKEFKEKAPKNAVILAAGYGCHASNYSSHLRQIYRRINSAFPSYRLS